MKKYQIDKEIVCNGCKNLWHKCAKCTALKTKNKLGRYSWNEYKALNTYTSDNKKYVIKDSACPGFIRK